MNETEDTDARTGTSGNHLAGKAPVRVTDARCLRRDSEVEIALLLEGGTAIRLELADGDAIRLGLRVMVTETGCKWVPAHLPAVNAQR